MSTLTIARRFRGPESSANGGYICGLVAGLAPWPVTVRLMKPPPLDTELDVIGRDGSIEVSRDGEVVAQARPGEVDLAAPAPPTHAQATAASRSYAGFARHPAPSCFVCGPERVEQDGLRIFPGAVSSGSTSATRVVAAPWTPDASLDAGDGEVGLEFMWAALDCPGYVAIAHDMRPMLLGELTAKVGRRVHVGERCTVIGWTIGSSGRKHDAGTALFDGEGRLCAAARALWIEPRAQQQLKE